MNAKPSQYWKVNVLISWALLVEMMKFLPRIKILKTSTGTSSIQCKKFWRMFLFVPNRKRMEIRNLVKGFMKFVKWREMKFMNLGLDQETEPLFIYRAWKFWENKELFNFLKGKAGGAEVREVTTNSSSLWYWSRWFS